MRYSEIARSSLDRLELLGLSTAVSQFGCSRLRTDCNSAILWISVDFQLVKLADPVLRRARHPKTLEGRALGVSSHSLGCPVRARVSATHLHPCAAGDLHVWPFVPRPLLWAYYKVNPY